MYLFVIYPFQVSCLIMLYLSLLFKLVHLMKCTRHVPPWLQLLPPLWLRLLPRLWLRLLQPLWPLRQLLQLPDSAIPVELSLRCLSWQHHEAGPTGPAQQLTMSPKPLMSLGHSKVMAKILLRLQRSAGSIAILCFLRLFCSLSKHYPKKTHQTYSKSISIILNSFVPVIFFVLEFSPTITYLTDD